MNRYFDRQIGTGIRQPNPNDLQPQQQMGPGDGDPTDPKKKKRLKDSSAQDDMYVTNKMLDYILDKHYGKMLIPRQDYNPEGSGYEGKYAYKLTGGIYKGEDNNQLKLEVFEWDAKNKDWKSLGYHADDIEGVNQFFNMTDLDTGEPILHPSKGY